MSRLDRRRPQTRRTRDGTGHATGSPHERRTGRGTLICAAAVPASLDLLIRPWIERSVVAGHRKRLILHERGRVEAQAVREVLQLLGLRDGVPAAALRRAGVPPPRRRRFQRWRKRSGRIGRRTPGAGDCCCRPLGRRPRSRSPSPPARAGRGSCAGRAPEPEAAQSAPTSAAAIRSRPGRPAMSAPAVSVARSAVRSSPAAR